MSYVYLLLSHVTTPGGTVRVPMAVFTDKHVAEAYRISLTSPDIWVIECIPLNPIE